MACPVGVRIKWVSLYMYARFHEGFLLGFGERFLKEAAWPSGWRVGLPTSSPTLTAI